MLLKVMGKLSYTLCYEHVEFVESMTLPYHIVVKPYQMVDNALNKKELTVP